VLLWIAWFSNGETAVWLNLSLNSKERSQSRELSKNDLEIVVEWKVLEKDGKS